MNSAKILIVEDDQFAADKLQLDLIQAGHRVVAVVDNATDCIDFVQTRDVDVVIVDIVLADEMDGIEAVAELRQFSDVSVVYLTAHESDDFLKRAEATRPVAYLLKPHRSRELDFMIRMSLERKRLERELKREKEEIEADLWYQATFDSLTGLPKRKLLQDRLHQIMSKSNRQSRCFLLMVIGLDNFKRVNESFGPRVGDEILYQVGQRISDVIRLGDTVARLHADVYAVLIELEESAQHTISHIAKKILKAIAQPIDIADCDILLTASCGIAMYPQDGNQVDSLLNNAEAAMFKAKSAEGNNTYRYYSQKMTLIAYDSMRMESELRQALSRFEFELYYQPQIDFLEGRVVGAEALIRWNHPEKGLIPPLQFIQLAEETGLIVPIGAWVIRQACHQLQIWQSQGLAVGRIAVNLSNAQFSDPTLLEKVGRILEDTGCAAEGLEIEITENCIMRSPVDACEKLQILRDMGIGIAVDDFGTGYSSLSYLKKLPLTKLKIDYSFVRDIPGDSNDAAIIRAIIAMSRSLRLDVIAEGVETQEQLDFFREEECYKVQGFYFAKPLPADDFERFVKCRTLRPCS